jgi:hypothetical protein
MEALLHPVSLSKLKEKYSWNIEFYISHIILKPYVSPQRMLTMINNMPTIFQICFHLRVRQISKGSRFGQKKFTI